MGKWRKLRRKGRGDKDVVDMLNINPLAEYKVRAQVNLNYSIANWWIEFQHHVGIYDGYGAYQAQQRDRSPARQPEEDG